MEKDFSVSSIDRNKYVFLLHPMQENLPLPYMGKRDAERYCDQTLKRTHNRNVRTIKTKSEVIDVNFLVHHIMRFAVADYLTKVG